MHSRLVGFLGTETFCLADIQMSLFTQQRARREATDLPADGVLSGKTHIRKIGS